MTNGDWVLVDENEISTVDYKPCGVIGSSDRSESDFDFKLDHIYCGNVIDVLKSFPDNCIDCAITSPPYWALRDYKTDDHIWDGDPNCAHEWGDAIVNKMSGGDRGIHPRYNKHRKFETSTSFCSKCGAWRGSLGLEPTFDLYVKHLCDIFDEVKRILKKTGTCWVNLGDTYGGSRQGYGAKKKSESGFQSPAGLDERYFAGTPATADLMKKSLLQIPNRFSIEMANRGWTLRNKLIWHKPNAMPQSVMDRFTVDYEEVFFFVKSRKYWFEKQYEPHLWAGRDKRSVKPVPPKSGKILEGKYAMSKVSYGKQGRNKRCVWEINTKSFKEAHFATFPEALIEPMVKAGCPEFVCNKCGKPREKIYKKTGGPPKGDHNKNFDVRINPRGRPDTDTQLYGADLSKIYREHGYPELEHVGYTSCSCGAGFSGGIVFDPFIGSGTSAVVAKKLGRRYLGVELNPEYVNMANKRIGDIML